MTTSRINIDPKIMMGKPVIKGTRITVEILLRKLSQGLTTKEIIKDYTAISKEDIKAAAGILKDKYGIS